MFEIKKVESIEAPGKSLGSNAISCIEYGHLLFGHVYASVANYPN